MRIGCLQFAPQVGDIDNNLNRADAVLAKANQDDLDSLDVLVLPELAFTGYAFSSLQDISPFLEPSGSGISSLWARTTALKYNTNVLVGYPERVDVSPKWPTGPEYYNSSILVNGDGETIANYRKTFLYPLDETWALEGKHGFFGGHVPGLGRMAMGICMDINPYKFEAPWHAFEFGFHILEVRANLVIVTMAWLTREECKDFTRMPNEPDMETLTYWIQRLEPVIRDESGEEIIVVFCNRTGMEGNAVYAGTSAVIGIQEGEVKVYGLLGRGVKELLIVDTDDAPFAKIVQREEAAQPESQDYRPQSSGQDSGHSSTGSKSRSGKQAEDKKPRTRPDNNTLPREETSSPVATESRKPSESSKTTRKQRPSVKVKIPEPRYVRTTTTSGKTPVAESPTVPTPTAPSPTPMSMRPKLVDPKKRDKSGHVDTPYPGKDLPSKKDQQIFGGSVSIVTEEERAVEDETELASEKFFWMPSSTLLHSPLDGSKWPVPDVYLPPQSPSLSTTLIKFPSRNSHRTTSSSLRDRSPRSEKSSSQSGRSARSGRSGRLQQPRQVEKVPPTRPATTTGAAPVRPASPKSRNASRTGRHERRASEVERPDIDDMIERLEALRRKTQSATAQRQNYSSTPSHDRPRSPKSRNASRSGRPSDSDIYFAERAFNLSRGSIPIGASDSVLASNIPRPQSDILGKNKLVNGSVVRAPSCGHYHTSSDPERPSSRTEGLPQASGTSIPHIEPEESRTMLWSEISKIVGEHLGRPDSRENTRGRQRNDSIMSTQARPESRGAPSNNRGAASQTRSGNGEMIRSVRDPSLGPPANPDDEIVAEIIFRRPGGPNQNSRSNSTENSGAPGERAGSIPSRKDPSRYSPESESTPAKKVTSPLSRGVQQSPAGKERERKHSSAPPGPQDGATGEEDVASPPELAGSSVHTLKSAKTSPTTPSHHAFEPSTPKAMILGPDYGSFLSTASDPLSNVSFEPLHNALVPDKAAASQIDRPRSAIW